MATLQYMYVSGTADASVLFVQVAPDQVEAGADTHVLSVLKNLGDQAAFNPVASVYLSSDETLGFGDVLLHQESYAYLLPDELVYLSVDVTIPAGTADGAWYVGVKLTSPSDGDSTNNEYVTLIDVGELDTCPADLNGDGQVDVNDILAIVSAFGQCTGCPEDIDGDGQVGVNDLLTAIASWGGC
jgi:hypothetical protein